MPSSAKFQQQRSLAGLRLALLSAIDHPPTYPHGEVRIFSIERNLSTKRILSIERSLSIKRILSIERFLSIKRILSMKRFLSIKKSLPIQTILSISFILLKEFFQFLLSFFQFSFNSLSTLLQLYENFLMTASYFTNWWLSLAQLSCNLLLILSINCLWNK